MHDSLNENVGKPSPTNRTSKCTIMNKLKQKNKTRTLRSKKQLLVEVKKVNDL